MDEPNSKLLSLTELSLALDIPARWLRTQALYGQIPCIQADTRLVFNLDAVVQALLDQAAEGRFKDGES